MGIRRVYRFVLLVLLIGIFVQGAGGIKVYACLYPPSDDGKDAAQLEEDNDIRYWHQGVIPADNSPITPGNSSIGSAACSSFAMTYALVKMGIYHIEDGDNPIKLINEGRENSMYSNGWYFDYCNIGRLYPDIECVSDFDYAVSGLGSEDAVSYIKGLMAEGKYVIACVNGPQGGHMVFFDGITEDGKVSIGDSAFSGLTWDVTYGAMHATMKYAVVLEYKEKSTDRPSIYDEVALREDKSEDSKDIEVKNALVEEYDLEGMPAKTTLADLLKVPHAYGREDFSSAELDTLRSIKETKDLGKKTVSEVVRVVIVILGILVIIYSILLVLGYLFDEFSPLHISLLGLLSFGGIKILHEGDDVGSLDKKKQRGYMKKEKFFIVVGVICCLGLLMVSGNVYIKIYRFLFSRGII